ncbi:NUDIX domain-containing protein [Candidatus Solirubrobacter pratensis]|uniref:NUDIX domain-containing protein n=1 Tax=Candidatus Solirubrobacter pratensis TaxID=1298857 RepID=UPI0003F727B4|nr:NUDIX hydrolase [Candidatus Solirubrobacter pratensis]
MSSRFELIDSEVLYEGGFITLRRDKFRHQDGEEVVRDAVVHPGAVGVVVLDDDENLWFVRQPREAVGVPDLLEIPAGKLDEDGESPLEAGKRELAEEIGKRAEHWESLGSFYTSPGFANEEVHLFLATGITDAEERPEVDENERIDVDVRPLSDLDTILEETKDSKTLIGLLKLKVRLAAG